MMARLNGIDIYYDIAGKGDPLVLIEGLGYSSWMWEFQRSLSDKLELVIYDNRGVGMSSKPEIPYTMDDFVNDLSGLAENIGLDSFFLLGASMGGMIAQEFAFRHENMLKGLILSSTNFGIHSKQPSADVLKILASQPSESSIYERMAPAFSRETLENRKDLVEKIIGLRIRRNDKVMQLQQISAVVNFDSLNRLGNLKMPVLILSGMDDNVVPPENSSRMHDLLTNSRLVKFRDAGHLVNMEKSEEYNREVLNFIKQVSSGQFTSIREQVVV
jgi:pimeloyl-ACP methyl ester carboxylesterase